ncbi:MAG: hypothetical protein ABIN94_12300 [Ferruginibacter sp.]
MKKKFPGWALPAIAALILFSGCAEHRYYHRNHYHTARYYHYHHRTPPPGVHIDIRN